MLLHKPRIFGHARNNSENYNEGFDPVTYLILLIQLLRRLLFCGLLTNTSTNICVNGTQLLVTALKSRQTYLTCYDK